MSELLSLEETRKTIHRILVNVLHNILKIRIHLITKKQNEWKDFNARIIQNAVISWLYSAPNGFMFLKNVKEKIEI